MPLGCIILGLPSPICAADRTINVATVELSCAVREDRTIHQCAILEERPKGAAEIVISRMMNPQYRVPEEIMKTMKDGRVRLRIPFAVIGEPTKPAR
jgi:hypothetical protein